MTKSIVHDGPHTEEALSMLSTEIKSPDALHVLAERAGKILEYSVDPISGSNDRTYGLLYGLIQSGKTSVITVTTAMAVDNGFKCVIILTSDINLLYGQTLLRIKGQLRGLPVLGKSDWNDPLRFERQIRTAPFVIVCSKNTNHLKNLSEAFKKVGTKGARGLATLIIDDEADQASLNTNTHKNATKNTDDYSAINRLISELRGYFRTDTFLQVTATPQSLFLQVPDGLYRPSFTVLSEPGEAYVGGEVFFGPDQKLLRYVALEEVDELYAGFQPSPTQKIPEGLKRALLSFIVGATAHNAIDRTSNFSFLCHISHTKVNHKHVIEVISAFREEAVRALKDPSKKAYTKLREDLEEAYQDIRATDPGIMEFDAMMRRIEFLLPGASIKEINSETDHEIALDHVYTIFVGGNKLGRGVTIPNLITSYYGRNPKRPNSDTVLQHARMYGYRQKYIGATRLFLPEKLADHFRIIHQMEKALRDLVAKYPEGKFEGIYIANPLRATRTNVLDPNSIGVYTAGSYCNPRYPLRTDGASEATAWLDERLAQYDDEQRYYTSDIDSISQLIQKTTADPSEGTELWDAKIITTGLEKLKTLRGRKAYIVVKRGRDLNEPRRETQGFLSGGDENIAPKDAPTLFIYHLNPSRKGVAVWWPLVRFPEGNYALAFNFKD
jgi:hypothetical protein